MAIVMNNHVFKGHRTLLGNKFVTYGELELPTRADIYPTSKSGFDWRNSSRGAHQLAFSMLFQLSSQELAEKYVEQFTHDVVRGLHARDWVLSASDVLEWIESNCELPKPQEQETKVKVKAANNTVKKRKKQKANIVKDICKELNITQKQLAEILEVPEGTVSSWAVKNEIPRLGKKAIEFYMKSQKNQKIVDSYRSFIELLQAS
ncbi:MAG: helix-turn-helix transcriptional regulator [Epsilonproteobacteria bacterium]|nr:helix-turn-helix transcriptional regulator [Campylobacterota bacterium]